MKMLYSTGIVLPALTMRTFQRRDFLPLRADLLWQIEQGVVRSLTWDDEGNPMTLGIWGKGDQVGRSLTQVSPYRLECLTPVVAQAVVMQPDPLVKIAHVHCLEAMLDILQQRLVQVRLVKFIHWLAQRFGCEVYQGRLIELRLTHQEIAETIGTSRVTVTRLLKQLEQEGAIRRSRQHLILLNQG